MFITKGGNFQRWTVGVGELLTILVPYVGHWLLTSRLTAQGVNIARQNVGGLWMNKDDWFFIDCKKCNKVCERNVVIQMISK